MFQSLISYVTDPSNFELVAAAVLPITSVILAYPIRVAYRRGKRAARKDLARQILPVMMDEGVVEYGFTRDGNIGPKFVPITKVASEKDVAAGRAPRVGFEYDNAPKGNKVMGHIVSIIAGDVSAKV